MSHITLENVDLKINVERTKQRTLRKDLIRGLVGGSIGKNSQGTYVHVLKDISIKFKENDFVGIIGHNGSGKTSFLRTLAGLYFPTSGKLDVSGKVSTLFSLGQGINPELSGVENIIRIAIFNGFDLYEAREIVDNVIDFSELGQFANFPLKTYSNGMVARLSFGVVTLMNPDILLIDEVIGVGDETFQKKARLRIENLISKVKILLLASHSQKILDLYCTRLIRFEEGEVFDAG